ncbi:hypothetical protein [Zavarzinella formosa]|uniref:hypothetical protein n=1 Tax=Zavarzinella formosa TaxID=360055 RepID=UPI0002E475D8|nr:hypothetical protein [Zavarzinella formosa]
MARSGVCALLGALFCLFLAKLCADDPPAKKAPLSVAELNERPVIGQLGLPLGTCAEIEAKIIAGRELRQKQYDGAYLLSVTHVAGKKLATPAILRFDIGPGMTVKLARGNFELHELKTGKKTGSLTGEEILKLEEGYVGKTVKLSVYEVGSFHGLPRKLPSDRLIYWADTEFYFSTSLVILHERP